MGSRANYVIIEDGRRELFYSHWGAQKIDRDFFFGPDVASSVVRSTEPKAPSEILDDIWCEGSAVIDFDARRLQCWGGEDVCFEPRLRKLWLQLVVISWPNWQVSWAEDGICDVAQVFGIPLPSVQKCTMEDVILSDEELLKKDSRCSRTFVTIRQNDGQLADRSVGTPLDCFIRKGPRIIELIEQLPTCSVPNEDGPQQECLFIDLPERSLWLNFGNSCVLPQWTHVVETHWPGWEVHQHCWGMERHLALTNRDPCPFFKPLRDHLPRIGEIILGSDTDPHALLELLKRARGKDEPLTHLNPHFLTAHRLEMSKEERMERFLAVVSEWKRRHPEHGEV